MCIVISFSIINAFKSCINLVFLRVQKKNEREESVMLYKLLQGKRMKMMIGDMVFNSLIQY